MIASRLSLIAILCLGGCSANDVTEREARATAEKTDSPTQGQCSASTCNQKGSQGDCYCDDACTNYGDCCSNFESLCTGAPQATQGQCTSCDMEGKQGDCYCDDLCSEEGDCCSNFESLCQNYTYNCDDSAVTCRMIKPTCSAGQVPSVVGFCWDDCVPQSQCAAQAASGCSASDCNSSSAVASGCYCDDACVGYGDCCSNRADVCD